MDQLAIARRAIEDEISALTTEISRLEKVLEALGGNESIAPYAKRPGFAPESSTAAAPAADAPKRRGRPKGSTNGSGKSEAAASGGDVNGALELIEQAGRKGIKALALAAAIKKAGGTRPSKEELLATEKVKMTGRGGGTTYTYVG